MAQYNNPFTGVPVGWDDGEDGWGQPLNTTLLQYAFYHSRNINGVVETVEDIPLSAANGSAYLVQENNRVYFASNLTWYFSVPPDGMKFRLVSNGRYYSKTSTGFVLDDEISEVAYSGDASDLTTGTLNVARTPAFSGDVTKPSGSATLTLSASGVTAGSYGVTDYTYPTVTIDSKGRITSAANKAIPDASTTVKGLMSSADKTKLNSVASGAEANVNADWNSVTGDSQILNKPSLGNLSSVNATPVGLNLVQSTNPTASIVFPRINADNTVSLLNDVDMKAALNITGGGGGGEGSVTSVGLTVPLGFSTINSPITSAGNIGLTFATGYSLPTTAKQTNWDAAYGWGNHASAGYAVNGTGGTQVRNNTQLDARYSQTDTNTTYSAGDGLTLSGTTFSLPVTATGSGSYVQSVVQTSTGLSVTLGTPPNTNTTYTAGTALTLSGNTFNVNVGTAAGSVAAGNDSRIVNGNTAYNWGNHSTAGYALNGVGATQVRTNTQLDSRYLQSFTETDPTVPSHVKSITTTNITNWNTAYTDRNKWDGGSAGLDAATGRNSLGLGTASQTDLVTSNTDTTAGSVPVLGWLGNGRTLAYKSQATDDLNDFNVAGAHGMWGGNSLNRPTNNVYVVHVLGGSPSSSEGQIPSRIVQVAYQVAGAASYRRSYDGSSWGAWQEEWNTGNTSTDVQALLTSANNAAIRSSLNVSAKVSTSNSSSTTLSLTDAMEGVITRLTSSSTKTVNVTSSLTVSDGQWHIRNVGTGNATLVAGSGVTINLPYQGSLVIPQGGTVTLQKVGSTNVYDLIGQTVVV